jgi:hypothetical protein
LTPRRGEAELGQALTALEGIARIRDEGRPTFEQSRDRQLAAAFCWANVGSALKQFCRIRGIGQGSSPFPGAIRMRDKILYQPIADLIIATLWDSCTDDTEELATLLRDVRHTLHGEG